MKKALEDLLYPDIQAYDHFRLDVGDGHELYVEQSGNPAGDPVIFLHGGPGGGINPDYRRYFNPDKYRVVLFDQRGAGKSTPRASIENNTTWHLVDDIQRIKAHLKIQQPWHVFGGSWGSTLALTYAITHPHEVKALHLRGIFLTRKEDINWFYQFGAHHIYPDAWQPYFEFIPHNERHDLVSAYYKRLTSDDKEVQLQAARRWSIWEAATSYLLPRTEATTRYQEDDIQALTFAKTECHYFINKAFFDSDNWILENCHKIQNIPTKIVHGRYDVVCPIKNAFDLKAKLPQAELIVIDDQGHSLTEPNIAAALIMH